MMNRKRFSEKTAGAPVRMRIFSKLFLLLLGFSVTILLLIWIFQIFLLDSFYERTKYKELNRVAEELSAALTESDQISSAVYDHASRYGLCVSVYRIDGNTANELVKSHIPGECVLHTLSASERTALYDEARANGGTVSKVYSTERHFVERDEATAEPSEDQNSSENEMETVLGSGNVGKGESESAISFHIIENGAGETYLLVLDSRLSPMVSVISTLKLQFLWLAIFLIVAALFLSLLIARIVSKPFASMMESANRLATGDYSASFQGSGFRESVELANALSYASRELSKTDAVRKDLIANVSHDLRTPLTMIKGYAEAIRDLPGVDTAENIRVVIEESEYMRLLVADLLDLSRFESGIQMPDLVQFDLNSAVCEALSRFDRLIHHDGYSIVVESNGEAWVLADRMMILRVLYNLISNAISYVGEDRTVRVRLTSEDGWVTVSVTDTGIGISEEELPYIWDRYYKGDKSKRRRTGGTGIGLSIVKNILIAHEARYGVRSTPGKGSTFYFSLPMTEHTGTAEEQPPKEENEIEE